MGEAALGEISLYDKEKDALITKVFKGQEVAPEYQQIPLGEGITGIAAQNKETIYVPDVEEDERYRYFLDGIKSELAVPMLSGDGTLIGLLNIEHPELDPFDENDIKLAKALANLATVAIENARLYDKLVRKLKEQQAVNKVGQKLTASIDLNEEEITTLIYEQASELMNTDNMYVALYEQSTDTVRFPLMFVDGVRRQDVAERKAGAGRTEHIIRTKKPLLIYTEKESVAWYKKPGREEYIGEPFASWLGVPITMGEEVLGVIAAYHKKDNFVYDKDDLEVLQAIASQAAIALRNIRYVDELEAFQDLAEDFSAGSFLGIE